MHHRVIGVALEGDGRELPGHPGMINYYGRFYKSALYPFLRRINEYLVRWAMQKYKRLRNHDSQAWRWLRDIARREPVLFAHWRMGVRP